mmetsp:Transcript_12570/g.16261  ORF Transcript_12570/g.16261 Transcript_12570/m.16261 type:complete len:630 (+) Transcript_12570:113-2002(+)
MASAANAAHLRTSSPIAVKPSTRFIFVTGGVVSGLGKGITISSLGRILKAMGIKVTCIKIDPYLNTDAGTMSPFEHGETFVLNDGGETDLDLGNYERFLDVELTKDHNITTGKIYSSVINKERRGDYLGKTVQVVPHITDEIQNWISRVSAIPVDGNGNEPPDVCLVEVGGTVGDIESNIFLEAMRQFLWRVGRERCCLVHVSLVVCLGSVGEQKTKPTQHGIRTLMSLGLSPDIIVCRSSAPLEDSTRRKISAFCHVSPKNVVSVHDVSNIYHVPLILQQQNIHNILKNTIGLAESFPLEPNMLSWKKIADVVDQATEEVSIAIVGKYTKLSDSYLSVIKACKHAAITENLKLSLVWIESSNLEESRSGEDSYKNAWEQLKSVDGIVIPGGFGVRGIDGKIAAVKYARTTKVPILGVCLGMQSMVIEFARNVLGHTGANSTEFDPSIEHKLVIEMLEHHTGKMGGTMRLGARQTILQKLPEALGQEKSIASLIYGKPEGAFVLERHRHRYEVNPDYVDSLEGKGLLFSGKDETNERMEIVELALKEHPYFFGVQYHPELKSRPEKVSPPFHGLILAAAGRFGSKYELPAETYSGNRRKRTVSKADGDSNSPTKKPRSESQLSISAISP